MRKRKSTCGLCKPTKKWKRRNVRATANLKQLIEGECSANAKLRIFHK